MKTTEDETKLSEAVRELRELVQRLASDFRAKGLITDAAICASIDNALLRVDRSTALVDVLRVRRAARGVGDAIQLADIGDLEDLRRCMRAFMRAADAFQEDTRPLPTGDMLAMEEERRKTKDE